VTRLRSTERGVLNAVKDEFEAEVVGTAIIEERLSKLALVLQSEKLRITCIFVASWRNDSFVQAVRHRASTMRGEGCPIWKSELPHLPF
jgi:hypothetical protein